MINDKVDREELEVLLDEKANKDTVYQALKRKLSKSKVGEIVAPVVGPLIEEQLQKFHSKISERIVKVEDDINESFGSVNNKIKHILEEQNSNRLFHIANCEQSI
jgi:hypothetical protein